MRISRFASFAVAVMAAAPFAAAGTINVPADYATIQAAINAAVDGDLVVVAKGTYKETINFLGKKITVQGIDCKITNIIPANGSGTVVTMNSGEDSNSVLTGFSIRNGSGTTLGSGKNVGGGILIDGNSSPQIIGNCFGFNFATDYGGGIYIGAGSSPYFFDNLIANNFTATQGAGGGIYDAGTSTFDSNRICENGAPNGAGGGVFVLGNGTYSNNMICQNFAFYGGGMQVHQGSPTISGNIYEKNDVTSAPRNGEGAGIGITGGATPFVTNCEFRFNTAHNGGGIYANKSSPVITGCSVHDNNAALGLGFGGGISFGATGGQVNLTNVFNNTAAQGGGVSIRGKTSAQFYGNLIDHNTANKDGGGVYSLNSKSVFVANTMANNTANDGGGFFAKGTPAPAINSGIVYFNTATFLPTIDDQTGAMVINNSDIEAVVGGSGNLIVDPLFVNAALRDYRLQSGSPVIDAGDVTLNPGGNDIYGGTRVVNARIDMGAAEGQ